jgi:hypothetical protein
MTSDTLDLHGIRHDDAERLVEQHIYHHQPPFEIITGNSLAMQQIVARALAEAGLDYFRANPHNMGAITVIEKL